MVLNYSLVGCPWLLPCLIVGIISPVMSACLREYKWRSQPLNLCFQKRLRFEFVKALSLCRASWSVRHASSITKASNSTMRQRAYIYVKYAMMNIFRYSSKAGSQVHAPSIFMLKYTLNNGDNGVTWWLQENKRYMMVLGLAVPGSGHHSSQLYSCINV